jgi:Holliday junction resolvase-like predicted endonuclease
MQILDSRPQDPEQWHTEVNVQKALVAALVDQGWQILAVRNTAKREPGIDVIAERDGQTLGAEVKGYPGRGYADPKRAGEKKKATPRGQAWNWYAKAVLAAMTLRSAEPEWANVIVLPVIPRYLELHAETKGSLDAAQIEVWWIQPSGELVGAPA